MNSKPQDEIHSSAFLLALTPRERIELDAVAWTTRMSRSEILREGLRLAAAELTTSSKAPVAAKEADDE